MNNTSTHECKVDHKAYCVSPIGIIEVVANDSAVTAVRFVESFEQFEPLQHAQKSPKTSGNAITSAAVTQLKEYFEGERCEFNLPLLAQGTAFQQGVWAALLAVPAGQTCSYADIASDIGNPKAVRAVGAANGQNPIGIVIPCHRIIGRNGKLTGYAHGLDKKAWLLQHEGAILL